MKSSSYNMSLDDTYSRGNNYGMYTDDTTTLYTDILPFDDHHLQKPDLNKDPLALTGHTDPWLMAQAGVSVTHTDTPTSSSDIFGRLSPTMEHFANSLLSNQVTLPLVDDVSFDVDIALNSLTTQNDGVLGAAMENLVLEPQNQVEVGPRRRSARLSSRAMRTPTSTEAHALVQGLVGLHPYPSHDLGATVEENPWSPVSNVDGAEDSGGAHTSRRRRPRVSYSTLTEEERYQRIRDLNNEASRHYRGRIREQLTSLQQREASERQRNTVLKAKVAGLERLRKEIEEYTHNILREHMGKHGVQ